MPNPCFGFNKNIIPNSNIRFNYYIVCYPTIFTYAAHRMNYCIRCNYINKMKSGIF